LKRDRMLIPFVKASACGNDFLLIERTDVGKEIDRDGLRRLTRRLCDRHEGVGADGVEWMHPHATADVEIQLINADGSEAEISGNGTRCVAAYLCEERKQETFAIQTGAGVKVCTLAARQDFNYEFQADMGKSLVEDEIELKVAGSKVRGIPVSMGNPHFVTFVREFPANWKEQAAAIQGSPHFPHGVNVEMVIVDSKHDVSVRFFERGVGITQSSGTGSCASAVAAIATGKTRSPTNVHTPGGLQTVRVQGGDIFLRGWARLVCRGEFFDSGL
jgi:diaminopimelate epimerase